MESLSAVQIRKIKLTVLAGSFRGYALEGVVALDAPPRLIVEGKRPTLLSATSTSVST
jgi:hypothetical protein